MCAASDLPTLSPSQTPSKVPSKAPSAPPSTFESSAEEQMFEKLQEEIKQEGDLIKSLTEQTELSPAPTPYPPTSAPDRRISMFVTNAAVPHGNGISPRPTVLRITLVYATWRAEKQ